MLTFILVETLSAIIAVAMFSGLIIACFLSGSYR